MTKKNLTFFKRRNCSNCLKVEEMLKKYSDLVIDFVDADENKDEVEQFAPKGQQWQLPLLVFKEDDKVVTITTGLINDETIDLIYKPVNELESLAYRSLRDSKMYEGLLKQAQTNAQMIEGIIQAKMNNVVEVKVEPVKSPVADKKKSK